MKRHEVANLHDLDAPGGYPTTFPRDRHATRRLRRRIPGEPDRNRRQPARQSRQKHLEAHHWAYEFSSDSPSKAKNPPKVRHKVDPKTVKIVSRRLFCVTEKTLNSAIVLLLAFAVSGKPGPSPIVNFPCRYHRFCDASLSPK